MKKIKFSKAEQVPNYSSAGISNSSSHSTSSSSLAVGTNRTDPSVLLSRSTLESCDNHDQEKAMLPPAVEGKTCSDSNLHPVQSAQQFSSNDTYPELEKLITQLRQSIEQCGPKSMGGCHLMAMAGTHCGVKLNWVYNHVPGPKKQNPIFVCEVLAEQILIGVGTDKSKKAARTLGCEAALNLMKKPRTELCVIATGPKSYQLISGPATVPDKPTVREQLGMNHFETRPNCADVPCQNIVVPSSLIVVIETYDNEAYANAIETLTRSAAFNKIPLDFVYQEDHNGFHRCNVTMNGRIIASASNFSKQLVKQEAATAALKYLKTISYVVKIKKRFIAEGEISRESVATKFKKEEAISEDNIGNKLLRMMGWSGGGLGKDGDGIAEPVKASTVFGREGLGLSSQQGITKNFIQQVTKVIREYAQSTSNTDLAFSSDFTSDERKEMHMIAKRFNLKSVSRGKGEERFLVLSRKFGPQQLVQHILERGGSTDKYELIPPPFAQ